MPRSLLVVDDIRTNRRVLINILGGEYDIVEAENGREALDIIMSGSPQLSAVLLDLAMPVMDGYEVLDHMQRTGLFKQLPVIVTTGQTDSDSEERALKLGANDYISKPYKSSIIKQRIKNTITLWETAAAVNTLSRDRLTGLYSREVFFEKAQEMAASQAPGYYVMTCFDIDKFKVINDQYGTEKGDEVLKHIARVFQEGFEAHGGICCRVAADNFAAFYPADFRNSPELADIRRRAAMAEGLALPIVFSIGRYVVDDLSLSASAMYDRASLAGDTVKGRYDTQIALYDESMRAHVIREQEIVVEMAAALKDKQFEVWYQPQYNHSTGALIGSEALVRWRHPQRGLIPPDEFIPIFEQNGFIYTLDKYVWEEACRFLSREYAEGGSPLPISVNISRYDVFRPDIAETIVTLVKRYDIPAEMLRLEITESAFAESTAQIITVVKRLIAYGFTLEIDDFGSGYSSLNTLKSVPAQVVKLDMRFFEDDDGSGRSGNIIESVVRMTKWLGMSVIAEGVEKIEQANFLRSIGCDYMQGYLYARPMPAADYAALCKNAGKEEKLLTLETVENLDNNAFWNPASMDTLIFNSYVGGACIFEYHKGHIELLRATPKYAQVIGSAGMTVGDALKLNWAEHMDEKNMRRVARDIASSISSRNEVTSEYEFLDLPGCPRETYLRTTMRVIATAGERCLVYCTNENMTAQRKAEQSERKTAEQLQAIMDSVDLGIVAAVLEDGRFSFLFSNDQYYEMLGYTREQFLSEVPDAFSLIVPEDRDRIAQAAQAIHDSGRSDAVVYDALKRDGSRCCLRTAISLGHFAGVEQPVLLSIFRDITKERQSEQRERRAAEQVKAIMDDIGSGVTAAVRRDGRIDFLFSNDRYYELHGYTRAQYQAEVMDSAALIHPDDRERIEKESMAAYQNGTPAQMEYRILTRAKAEKWLRVDITSTRFTGVDENVNLCIFTDITQRKQNEKRILETDDQLRFLNETAHELLAQPDSDRGIREALTKLLSYFDGERAYVFEFDTARATASNTYETCTSSVISEQENLQNIPIEGMSFWMNAFRSSGYIDIENVDALDDSRAEERKLLKAQNIRALIAVPLRRDGQLIGFIGIDDPRQHARIERLAALGDYIAVMLTRRDLNAKISSDNRILTSMMNDMPGGFVRMRVHPDGRITPVYFNDGFFKLTGMNYDELMSIYENDALAGVHPDDVGIVRDAVESMLQNGKAYSARYRLMHKSGDYIWISFFGRVTKDASGEAYLNVYYTDAGEQVREEEKQKDILDNLPHGAALYEFDGERIRLIHLNKRYWELVGRKTEDASPNFLSAVHEDDRKMIMRELGAAIRQSRDIVCDVRIRYGEGSTYRSFHINGRIVLREDGRYAIYASYTPLDDEAAAYQRAVPAVLSAIMESTTDLSFAKDAQFRYICGSSAFAHMIGLENENDLIGKTDYDLFAKELADKYRGDDETLLQNGKPIIDQVEMIPAENGIMRYSSTSKYILRDAGGAVMGLYGVGHDITEYRDTFSRLKLLTENMPGGIATYECSPRGLRLLYFNEGYCRLFGMTREEYERAAATDPTGFVFREDLPGLESQIDQLIRYGTPTDCFYRIRCRDGVKWISHKAVAADRYEDAVIAHAMLQDVTVQREMMERLRQSEEESELAVRLGESIICRYDIAGKRLMISPQTATAYGLPETAENVPYEPVKQGMISEESIAAYIGFFESILRGEPEGSVIFQERFLGKWRWLEARSATIFSNSGEPVKAIITIQDITERLEKETVYKKWQQSLEDKDPASYTLFRCNLSKDASFDTKEGALLQFRFDEKMLSFQERTLEYAGQCVCPEDRARYTAFLDSDALLAGYYRGKHAHQIEYRELFAGGVRWLKLSVELLEYPNSTDVEAYLMYEDIDAAKREELHTRELVQRLAGTQAGV